jgi:hypothetical protein
MPAASASDAAAVRKSSVALWTAVTRMLPFVVHWGDVARWLVISAPLLVGGVVIQLLKRRRMTRPWGRPVRSGHRNRERGRSAALRGHVEAGVCLKTTLDRVSVLGTGGFGGTRGVWISVRGPKRLTVGTDAFTISAPQALREFVFSGPESSIAFGQAVNPDDCIMITGQADGRRVQLAITGDNLQGIWQALAGTGATLV